MASRLTWEILGGVILGTAFGYAGGSTAIGMAVFIAVGAIAVGIWHLVETRK